VIFDLEALEKPITALCAPLQDAGITVRWPSDQKRQQGNLSSGATIGLRWGVEEPVQGVRGNRVTGASTIAHYLFADFTTPFWRGPTGHYTIRKQLKQLLQGEAIGKHFFEFAGYNEIRTADTDPTYRGLLRFRMIVNESVDRHA